MAHRIPALIVLNAESGRGQALWVLQNHLDLIRKKYDILHIFEKLGPSDVLLLQEFFSNETTTVILVGGDGTLHHFINLALPIANDLKVRLELGIISSGTGCDFSRSLGKAGSTRKEVSRLLQGHAHPLDLGLAHLANEKLVRYVNSASLGLGGHTLARLKQWHRSYLPKALSYMVPGAESFFSYKGLDLQVEVDGTEIFSGRSLGVMAYNGRFSGGGMPWAPLAKIDDGKLDVVVKKPIPVAKGVQALMRLFAGKIHQDPGVIYRQGSQVSVVVQDGNGEDAPLELDGELFHTTSVKFAVENQVLDVIY